MKPNGLRRHSDLSTRSGGARILTSLAVKIRLRTSNKFSKSMDALRSLVLEALGLLFLKS